MINKSHQKELITGHKLVRGAKWENSDYASLNGITIRLVKKRFSLTDNPQI